MTAPHGAAHPSEDAGVPKDHLVWSIEHNAWWAPRRAGYRTNMRFAGLYTKEEAERITRLRTNDHGEPMEQAVPLSEARRKFFELTEPDTFGACLQAEASVSPVPAPTPEAVAGAPLSDEHEEDLNLAEDLNIAEAFVSVAVRRAVDDEDDDVTLLRHHLQSILAEMRRLRAVEVQYLATPQPPREGEGDVYAEIRAERVRQDAQWGGPARDDENVGSDWYDYRQKFERRARTNAARRRDALVKIAALAVAQVESLDRKHPATPEGR